MAEKDKTLTEYRGLNQITVKIKYPLHPSNSVFKLLQGASVFTKLNLRNPYHVVRIREGDEWKMAFNTRLGHFKSLVMPSGLTNAPAVFQVFINDVLRDFLNLFVYLEEILIFSKSMGEHQVHVHQVLHWLLENRLYVKAEKCEFHVTTVSFLGFVFQDEDLSGKSKNHGGLAHSHHLKAASVILGVC